MNTTDLQNASREELIEIISALKKQADIPYSKSHPLHISYKTLVEAASDFIFVLDRREHLVYWNSSWEQYFSQAIRKEVGLHYSEYVPVAEKERISQTFKTVFNDGQSYQNELVKTYDKNNRMLYFLVSLSPVRSEEGEISGLVGIMNDATESVLTQRRLKENTRLLQDKVKEQIGQAEEYQKLHALNQDIINNAPIGIFIMDRSGVMLSENPALKKMMGYETESRIGFNLLDYSGFVNSGMFKRFEECLNEKKTVKMTNIAYRPMSKQTDLIIDYVMDPLIDENGVVNRVVVMIQDNTEHALFTKRINRAEKLSFMGFLASGVALKLRTPVDKMYMDLNFVQNNLDKSSAAIEYVEALKSELHGLKNVSEQLLALSQSKGESVDSIEINKVITTHPLDVLINRLKSEGFDIDIKLPEISPTVNATKSQMKQILFDIIENSADAMPEKGTITIEVDALDTDNGSFATIAVSDEGIGIPEDNLGNVFKPFFTTKGENATGLGLMIASTLVENLGGTIGIKSSPGKGTTIKMAFPLAYNKQ